MNAKRFSLRSVSAALALVCAGALLSAPAHAASITEPPTVFYGRVIGTGSGQPFMITEGILTWTIRRDGVDVTLSAKLFPWNDGEFSYRFEVPHEVLALGLDLSGVGVPLGTVDQTLSHVQILVNGLPARILGPSGASFDAAQARRTATYRLDLQVGLGGSDLDGNGLADWWETRYSLNDPNGDGDGDGWNNLAEFRNGSDPKKDNRIPSLATKEVRAYADGTALVLLRAIDSDSGPTNLIYGLTRTPDSGALYLRNAATGSNADVLLDVGTTFSQADVNRGRLVFVHASGADASPTSFEVSLHDETPSHPTSTNTIYVNLFRPSRMVTLAEVLESNAPPTHLSSVAAFSTDEQSYVMSYVLSRDMAYVVCDGSAEIRSLDLSAPSSGLTSGQYDQYKVSYGPDRHHIFIGGPGADHIVGTMESDIIIGGPGNDLLRGNGGADLFILTSRDDGSDTIEDFNASQDDRIDLTRALTGNSPWLTNYLQLVTSSSNSTLRINCAGTGAPFSNMVLTLSGVLLTQSNLVDLVENGHIITGDKGFTPRVSIAATTPAASENGPASGEFTLTRTGSTRDALTINLQITGSAVNGTDYRYVPSQVTFLAGQRSLILQITPYIDAIVELTEVADVVVLAGAGYEVGTASHAQVTIEDLMPSITIEALEPLAVKSDQTPGYFLITRDGIVDRSVFVRLTIGGTAANGSDYQSIPAFVNLSPFQTTALITVTPKTTAVLSNGIEYVQLTVKTDSTYKVSFPSVARVVIVEEQLTFDLWRSRYFGGSSDLSVFGNQDSGQTGVRNLHRYAFGLNPSSPQLSRGAPEFKIRDGRLMVAFRKPLSVTQVQYVVEVSDDLVTWHSGDQWWEEYAAPEYAGQLETMCYRARQTVGETPKLFMRVRVAYAP